MFYCRENELSKLEQRYRKGSFECIIIYGRRRIGKTALINQFCSDKPTIFFSALKATAQENLTALSKAIETYKNPTATATPAYSTFEAALDEITRLSQTERLVFVIDEYPYLAKAEEAISSRIQHLIDHVWQNSKLYLILCGSSMSFMEKQVLGYESPLYGRRTAQFKLLPLTYRESAVFHPDFPPEKNALIYGITGGVPHYINKLDVTDDLDEALLENLFERSSYLYEEPENLLKQELREPAVYNSIITAIATGASHMNEIATKTGIDSSPCSKYMKSLIDLGIVKRETPITEKPGRKTVYSLDDNFFRFWYRFVPQNQSAIQSGRIRRIYEATIKKYYPEYMGLVFEQICRQYLLNYAENLPVELTAVGQWWGSDAKNRKEIQIDIVGTTTSPNEYLMGSCKYRNMVIGVDELERLKEYSRVFRSNGKMHYILFSKSGFTAALVDKAEKEGVMLVTLNELY